MDGPYIGGRDIVYPVTAGTNDDRHHAQQSRPGVPSDRALDRAAGACAWHVGVGETTHGADRARAYAGPRRCNACARAARRDTMPIGACWCPQPRSRRNSNCSNCAGHWSRSPSISQVQRANAQQRRTAPHSIVLAATTSVDDFATSLQVTRTRWWSARHTTNSSRWRWRLCRDCPGGSGSPTFTDLQQDLAGGRQIAHRDPGRHRAGTPKPLKRRRLAQRLPVGSPMPRCRPGNRADHQRPPGSPGGR